MKYLIHLGLLLFTPFAISNSDLNLTGVGLYSDLRAPYFYSAIYTDVKSIKPNVILSSSDAIRMEIKIVANSISKRRFNKLMNEMIVINNNEQALNSQATNIIEFMGVLDGSLLEGDNIVIDNSSGKALVKINGVDVLVINDKAFVKLLLNGWIGRFPPTPDFKKDILNGESSPHLAEFLALKFTQDRLAVIKTWNTPLKKDINEQRIIAQEDAMAKVFAELEKTRLLELKKEQEKNFVSAEEKIAFQNESKKEIELLDEKNKHQRDARLAKLRSENEKLRKAQKELQLTKSSYYRKLVNQTNKEVVYPNKSMRRGEEGQVKVRISIDLEGNVANLEVVQSSNLPLLDEAALSAVKKAAPFPVVPKILSLNEDLYDVTIPFRFDMKR